ncbi:blue light receptor, partial [Tulasnella sp. 427]
TLRIAHPDLVAAAKEDAAVATSSSSRRRSEKEPRSADDIAVDSNSAPMNPFAFDFTFPGPTTSNGGFPPGGVPSVPATGEDVNMMRRHSIAGSAAAEDTSSRKRGKRKAAGLEQRVCHTCGRTDSPEWRKGPLGPKTLCNACGLRFSKKVKTKPSDSNDKEGSPPAAVALDPGVDGEGEDDAGDLQGLDGTGIIAADALTQSPIVHAHRELDFSAARMGYDMSGMGGSAAGGPPPPLSSSKLPASHSVSGRHASFSGILPSPSSIPLPFANPSASPTTTAAHAHNSYFPVSMTMSMPSNLSAFFASSNGHGSSGRTPTYELPGYGLGNMDHSIRAPQPKQALPPLQTHFEYDGVVGLGSAAPPTSALSSGTHHVLTASSGAGYHHYQPPSGQP